MKNFISTSETITVPAPAGGVLSGALVIIGDLMGVATTDALVGVPVALKRRGVWELPKASAEAWTVGQTVYAIAGNPALTSTAAGNTRVGFAAAVAANPSAVGRVCIG